VLCCAVLCCAVLCCAVLCCAQKGQLGHGDLLQRNTPTVVAGLTGKKVVGGEGQLQDVCV